MSLHVHCPEGHEVAVGAAKIGAVAFCPHCYCAFTIKPSIDPWSRARKEESKSRRARDDDDEDDDEEDEDDEEEDEDDDRPRKQAKKKKDEDDDEDEQDEKPRKKKAVARDDDDEDEEEEEDEKPKPKPKKAKADSDDEDEEEEEEIEWNPRKRQLQICSHAVMVVLVAMCMLGAFAVFATFAMLFFQLIDDAKTPEFGPGIFRYVCVPLLYLSILSILTAMIMSFASPAKVEGRVGIISALVFGGLVLFQGLLMILNYSEALVEASRVERFTQFLAGGSILCFIFATISCMGYLSKLLYFMNLRMESSQPVTSMGFVFMCYLGMLVLIYVDPIVKGWFDWLGYILALVFAVVAAFCIYLMVYFIFLLVKLREAIAKYIREA
jgi:hypothetical protein